MINVSLGKCWIIRRTDWKYKGVWGVYDLKSGVIYKKSGQESFSMESLLTPSDIFHFKIDSLKNLIKIVMNVVKKNLKAAT